MNNANVSYMVPAADRTETDKTRKTDNYYQSPKNLNLSELTRCRKYNWDTKPEARQNKCVGESLTARQRYQQTQLENSPASESFSPQPGSVLRNTDIANLPDSLQNSFFGALGMDPTHSGSNHVYGSAALQSITKLQDFALESSRSRGDMGDFAANTVFQHIIPTDSGPATIILCCEPKSDPFETRTILLKPKIECRVGRHAKQIKASESNAIFDCKVLSRDHAILWFTEDGRFWVKDMNSNNGTFINEKQLADKAAELHFGDILQFGVTGWSESFHETYLCIIASVRLYLPDGYKARSHDGKAHVKSYDSLHRLSLDMQKTQRERQFELKTSNLHKMSHATSKLSPRAPQDQQVHDMHSLKGSERRMESDVPDSTLRNGNMQLLEDKRSYQQPAKGDHLKVGQERGDAVPLLSKAEATCATSGNQCKLPRNLTRQQVGERLLLMEEEYISYKENVQRQLLEAREHWKRSEELLLEQLGGIDMECEVSRENLNQPEVENTKHTERESDEEEVNQLENQASVTGTMAAIAEEAEDWEDLEQTTQSDADVRETMRAQSLQNRTSKKWPKNSDISEEEELLYDCEEQEEGEQEMALPEEDAGVSNETDTSTNSDHLPLKIAEVQQILHLLEAEMSRANTTFGKESADNDNDNSNEFNYKYHFQLLKHCVAVTQEAYNDVCLRKKQNAAELQAAGNLTVPAPTRISEVRKSRKKRLFWLGKDNGSDDGKVSDDASTSDEVTEETKQGHSPLARLPKHDENEDQRNSECELQHLCEEHERKLAEMYDTMDRLRAQNQELVEVINEIKYNTERTEKAIFEAQAEVRSEAEDKNETGAEPTFQAEMGGIAFTNIKTKPKTKAWTLDTPAAAVNTPTQSAICDIFDQHRRDFATLSRLVKRHERKLIMYKKRCKKTEIDNNELWKQVTQFQQQIPNECSRQFMSVILPCGAVVIIMFIYFVTVLFKL